MNRSWGELAARVAGGDLLDGERLTAYLVAAAGVVVDARNRDDLDLAASVLAADVLEAARRVDVASAGRARTGEKVRDNERVVLDGIEVRPVSVTSSTSHLVARAVLTHRGRSADSDEPLLWKESWEVTIPVEQLTGGGARCDSCGAPRESVTRCRYCGTFVPASRLAEATWRVTRRQPA